MTTLNRGSWIPVHNKEAKEEHRVAPKQLLFVGGYSQKLGHVNGQAQGISVCEFDSVNGVLIWLKTVSGPVNPSFLFKDPTGPYLYCTQEMYEEGKVNGMLNSYTINGQDLELLSIQQTLGVAPCYISMNAQGSALFVANYMTGNLTRFQVDHGALSSPQAIHYHGEFWSKATDPGRQECAHCHCADLNPANSVLLACDLGSDVVAAYTFKDGVLSHTSNTPTKPGAGPRHLTFSPDTKFVYTSNELDNTINVFEANNNGGEMKNVQCVSMLGEVAGGVAPNASHITFHPNGKFIYSAVRFTDEIVVFDVDSQTGMLSNKQSFSCGGLTPRHFSFDPLGHGCWLPTRTAISSPSSSSTVRAAQSVHTALQAFLLPQPSASTSQIADIRYVRNKLNVHQHCHLKFAIYFYRVVV